MPNFSQRSFEKELLDEDGIPFEDIKVTLDELHFINTYLGGYNATRFGLDKLLRNRTNKVKIVDVGCGGGDNMMEIAKWCQKRNIDVEIIGIDMKDTCITYARNNTKEYDNMRFITSDYRHVDESFDIVHSCLFTHHLDDEQLNQYLSWSKKNSKLGAIINDLHRNYFAYHSIKILTAIFSKSYLVKNDACLSVLRSFKGKEWKEHSEKAGFEHCELHWNWAFRYTTILRNG